MAETKPTAAAKRAATAKTTTATAAPKSAATTAKPKAAAITHPTQSDAKTGAGHESFREQATNFKGKATDKAREYADSGKDKAANLLDSLAKTVADLAGSVDERLGTGYGDYTRRAADAVSGAADTLKAKDVDEIVADTREFVKSRPAIAIGAAAAVGFLIARLVKSGSNDREDS